MAGPEKLGAIRNRCAIYWKFTVPSLDAEQDALLQDAREKFKERERAQERERELRAELEKERERAQARERELQATIKHLEEAR